MQATFICCDGTSEIERVEDYGSTTFCAQTGTQLVKEQEVVFHLEELV